MYVSVKYYVKINKSNIQINHKLTLVSTAKYSSNSIHIFTVERKWAIKLIMYTTVTNLSYF